jgi:hypothetical protein
MTAHGVSQVLIMGAGFREQNIEHDGFGARRIQPFNQSSVGVSGPGPLSKGIQAAFIDGHQRNIPGNVCRIGGNNGVVKPEIQALRGSKVWSIHTMAIRGNPSVHGFVLIGNQFRVIEATIQGRVRVPDPIGFPAGHLKGPLDVQSNAFPESDARQRWYPPGLLL